MNSMFMASPSRHIFLSSLFVYAVLGAALQNITLPLPVGTSNHGTPGLLCTPTKWTDIISFYLFNYVAHAATVITQPGERSFDFAATVVGVLLFPALGLYRGIDAILSGAIRKGGDLRKAERSGALCMLVRDQNWRPVGGDRVSNAVINSGEGTGVGCRRRFSGANKDLHIITYQAPWMFSKFGRPVYVHRQIIHGTYTLPDGYRFVIVPSDAQFTHPAESHATIEVASTYNFVKALVALAQTGYASLTLYHSRGNQIEQFGFAAFGLTVAPYAVMSVVNLIGNLCKPDYASLYMVESSIMDEAWKRGGRFEGVVGRLEEEISRSVCSCTTPGADDVEDLHFEIDDSGILAAKFGVEAPSNYIPFTDFKEGMSTPRSGSASIVEHACHIKPLPEKMDYKDTEKHDLLFIPSANPLKRRLLAPEDPIARYEIDTVRLNKPSWLASLFNKSYYWTVTFSQHTYNTSRPRIWRTAKYTLSILISLTPLIIVGTMSHFKPGSIPLQESGTWRAYTIQWLIVGVFIGTSWVLDQEGKDARPDRKYYVGPMGRMLTYIGSASPAVGGFVVVGQMLNRLRAAEFGEATRIMCGFCAPMVGLLIIDM
ncbi:hypothetical protein CC78DRAFT_614174 [Lojkania enalia]|uniref:Uncharacterized protein n=1 Tax=Lojkania enalia TaxID=147567 RepID=A0A9P4KDY2_9PLEO|nr:hypothetical protein CC78DRAFT_614174 [Didymosphaeria enalia]